jgi:hypothetical protein
MGHLTRLDTPMFIGSHSFIVKSLWPEQRSVKPVAAQNPTPLTLSGAYSTKQQVEPKLSKEILDY